MPGPVRQRNADVEAECRDLVVVPDFRKIHRVQFDAADIVGNERDRAEKRSAVVVGMAADDGEGATDAPALAKLELVAQRGNLRPVSPRILVRARLGKGDASWIIGQLVVDGEPGIDPVVQMPAVGARAIGMIREPVQVEIDRIR